MKRFTLVMAILCVSIVAWAQAPAKTIVLKAAHIQAPETDFHKANIMFAEKVKEYTKGAVEIVVYPAQQLGDERTIMEGIFMGSVDIAMNGPGFSVGGVPEISVAELPFLYKSYAHANKAIPQVLIPYMNSKTMPKGVMLFDGAYAYTAYRGTLSKTRRIQKFVDLKGLKIRVPQNPFYVNTFQAAGANTAVINFGELYTALQTGVVDACELPPEILVGAKLQEVAKNFSLTQHIMAPLFLGINMKSWEKVARYQNEIKKAAVESMGWLRGTVEVNDRKFLQIMKDSGVTVYDLGDGERQKFREAAQRAYWQDFFARFPETKAIADKVLAIQ